jgi:hypothetical protein
MRQRAFGCMLAFLPACIPVCMPVGVHYIFLHAGHTLNSVSSKEPAKELAQALPFKALAVVQSGHSRATQLRHTHQQSTLCHSSTM